MGHVIASTAISYQGRLDAGGQAFDGSVDMAFELFDADPTHPTQKKVLHTNAHYNI